MTRYLVFEKVPASDESDADPTYELVGEFDSHDAKSAIGVAAKKIADGELKMEFASTSPTFCATPKGSWREHTFSVARETKVNFA